MTKQTRKCKQCEEPATHRGCCFNCYQRVRRAVVAGTLTWAKAVSRGLVENKGKPGKEAVYAVHR